MAGTSSDTQIRYEQEIEGNTGRPDRLSYIPADFECETIRPQVLEHLNQCLEKRTLTVRSTSHRAGMGSTRTRKTTAMSRTQSGNLTGASVLRGLSPCLRFLWRVS